VLRLSLLVAGVAVLATVTAAPAAATTPGPTVAFHLNDPRIDEASGIAAGIASPHVLYVQNDSGDQARFFALDKGTGRTLATYLVPHASNVDWEDIAVAPDARGVPSVWLGDIGDNRGARHEIDVYRVDEPHVDRSGTAIAPRTSEPQLWRLRYPHGPNNAESLAVAPGGNAYVVTKSVIGDSMIFALPARPDPTRIQVLRPVGQVRFGFTGTQGGPSRIGQLTATGAGFSRDGSILAVRTYTDAYLWRVRNADLAAAVQARPVRVALPAQRQGEGIAVDDNHLLVDSEGVGSAVYKVELPASVTHPRPTQSDASRAPSSSAAPVDAATEAGPPRAETRSSGWVQVGATLLIIALVVATAYLMRRGRRGR
jgi:hypothetical protein